MREVEEQEQAELAAVYAQEEEEMRFEEEMIYT